MSKNIFFVFLLLLYFYCSSFCLSSYDVAYHHQTLKPVASIGIMEHLNLLVQLKIVLN